MTAAELWESHTFRVLLDDVFKARRDNELGPMRLETLIKFVESTLPAPATPLNAAENLRRFVNSPAFVAIKDGAGLPPAPRPIDRRPGGPATAPVPRAEKPRIIVEGVSSESPAIKVDGYELSELVEQNQGEGAPAEVPAAANLSYLESQRALRGDPNASLRQAADIVEAAVKEGRWDGSGQMAVRVPRNLVTAGLDPMLRERRVPFSRLTCSLPPRNTRLEPGSSAALSGAQGEATDGWVILLER